MSWSTDEVMGGAVALLSVLAVVSSTTTALALHESLDTSLMAEYDKRGLPCQKTENAAGLKHINAYVNTYWIFLTVTLVAALFTVMAGVHDNDASRNAGKMLLTYLGPAAAVAVSALSVHMSQLYKKELAKYGVKPTGAQHELGVAHTIIMIVSAVIIVLELAHFGYSVKTASTAV